jgi:2-C-methyl-D-erythritol 4-phosphate cytidylyltransferase
MISAILLSGGQGKRMKREIPKQYLPLQKKPIILHALEALLSFPSWSEIVIVCEKKYQGLFTPYQNKASLLFASPGKSRQDSVFSGLQTLSSNTKWVCVHDGARPLLLKKDLEAVLLQGQSFGAAALAVPVKMTIKETDNTGLVKKTIPRSHLWEIQTPQVLAYHLLQEGHQKALKNHYTATDDVSLAEYLDHPVLLVEGSYSNLKITTEEDLELAEILRSRHYD